MCLFGLPVVSGRTENSLYNMVIPENTYTSNITHIEQVILRNIYVHRYKEAMSLKDSNERYKRGLGGRMRKEEIMGLYYNIQKIKEIIKKKTFLYSQNYYGLRHSRSREVSYLMANHTAIFDSGNGQNH